MVENIRNTSWEDIEQLSGVTRAELLEAANLLANKKKIIICWAMGLTQQRQGVQTIQELVNLLLIKGAIGKPGAGTCPVRGHSNVQGDRTMGIWEQPSAVFLDALEKEFHFSPPREHGLDTVESIKAMYEGKVKVYFGLGGNLLAAGPDTELIAEAMRRQRLTVYVGTKLNRGTSLRANQPAAAVLHARRYRHAEVWPPNDLLRKLYGSGQPEQRGVGTATRPDAE
jgi:anaerobic selenocysteine-containing dehydrogenase